MGVCLDATQRRGGRGFRGGGRAGRADRFATAGRSGRLEPGLDVGANDVTFGFEGDRGGRRLVDELGDRPVVTDRRVEGGRRP